MDDPFWVRLLMGAAVLAAVITLFIVIYRTTYINDDWENLDG